MVIDTQIDEMVIEAAVAATWAHDKQRCRLFSSTISSSCLARGERFHQPVTEVARGLFKGVRHG
jgi:hypothetical protein